MSTTNWNKLLNASPVQRPDYRLDMFGNKQVVPGELLDRIAEEKFSGGYNLRKSNRCDTCFEFKSTNGACSCTF